MIKKYTYFEQFASGDKHKYAFYVDVNCIESVMERGDNCSITVRGRLYDIEESALTVLKDLGYEEKTQEETTGRSGNVTKRNKRT